MKKIKLELIVACAIFSIFVVLFLILEQPVEVSESDNYFIVYQEVDLPIHMGSGEQTYFVLKSGKNYVFGGTVGRIFRESPVEGYPFLNDIVKDAQRFGFVCIQSDISECTTNMFFYRDEKIENETIVSNIDKTFVPPKPYIRPAVLGTVLKLFSQDISQEYTISSYLPPNLVHRPNTKVFCFYSLSGLSCTNGKFTTGILNDHGTFVIAYTEIENPDIKAVYEHIKSYLKQL